MLVSTGCLQAASAAVSPIKMRGDRQESNRPFSVLCCNDHGSSSFLLWVGPLRSFSSYLSLTELMISDMVEIMRATSAESIRTAPKRA